MARDTEHRAFFGRRTGKRLHTGQQALFETLLPKIEIPTGEEPVDLASVFPGAAECRLEIGYGGGEHLTREALANPDIGYIGCEVFTGGIGKMLRSIETREITNVRLFTEDAIKLLARLPEAGLSRIDLLYPDPWPKTRHHKRRFVSQQNLDLVARALKPGGMLRFATDIEDYANWTLAQILRRTDLAWEILPPGRWLEPYPDWEPTRYEKKARKQGRMKSFYFIFYRS